MATEFKLPDLGENIASGDVVTVFVSEGDVVKPGQALLEVETDKAVIEVPCPPGGRIAQVLVKKGDTVKVGQTLVVLDAAGGAAAPAKPAPQAPAQAPTQAPAQVQSSAPGTHTRFGSCSRSARWLLRRRPRRSRRHLLRAASGLRLRSPRRLPRPQSIRLALPSDGWRGSWALIWGGSGAVAPPAGSCVRT
jgi:pyruvate/2-oxoglutarate dehydrogenase complex dihydrolipoamide acyltransferase (E2) component